MLFFPNAKINLGLRILGKRPDGYHNLLSYFLPVFGLQDILEIVPAETDSFKTTGLVIEGDRNNNLVWKALGLLRATGYQVPPTYFHLHKIIPMGAGLGGGSSDGAFALIGLNKVYSLGISNTELAAFAAQLGSDCPFFIENKASLVSGRGENIVPFQEAMLPSNLYLTIVHPNIHIGTAEAFRNIDRTKVHPTDFPKPLAIELQNGKVNWNLWKENYYNQFEASVFPQHPKLQELANTLKNCPGFVSMTGSGSAIYHIGETAIPTTLLKEYGFVWQGIIS